MISKIRDLEVHPNQDQTFSLYKYPCLIKQKDLKEGYHVHFKITPFDILTVNYRRKYCAWKRKEIGD